MFHFVNMMCQLFKKKKISKAFNFLHADIHSAIDVFILLFHLKAFNYELNLEFSYYINVAAT